MEFIKNIFSKANPQDLYLSHLAGQKEGSSPIGWNEQQMAYGAQKHPIFNKVASVFSGISFTVPISLVSFLALSLRDTTYYNGVFGDNPLAICNEARINASHVYAVMQKLQRAMATAKDKTMKEIPKFFVNLEATTLGEAGGIEHGAKCLFAEDREPYRLLNLIAAPYRYAYENPAMATTIALGTLGIATLWTYSSYIAQEKATRLALKEKLFTRYQDIASRLEQRNASADPKVKDLATGILGRKKAIEDEIRALKAPKIDEPTIAAMTKPLFEAAKRITAPAQG